MSIIERKFSLEKENLVIVDANAIVHSSFHGYEPKLDEKGRDQRVLYGLINSLIDLTYKIPKIDNLYMVFDPDDGSTYRKSMFPAYKANRPPQDEELVRQRKDAKKIIKEFLGIPLIHYPAYEADDIIGTLVALKKSKYQVVVVSPDKDLAQLVSDDVLLMRKMRSKTEKGYNILNHKDVYELFGVYPHQIPDWLSLVGDAADNLPGLDGIGEKRATKILSQYPSIEHLIAIAHEIESKDLQEKINSSKDTLPIVKKLATIVCDLNIEKNIESALLDAENIRTAQSYKERVTKLETYFRWPPYFKSLFV